MDESRFPTVTDDSTSSLRTLRDLFEELVDVPPETREARLAALDLSVSSRAELAAMLAAHQRVSPLWQTNAEDVIHRLREDEFERGQSLVGTRLGSFRLAALIGQGGSSVVFRATREVGDGAQTVALKLLRTGLYAPDQQRSFRREQGILAQLTHANIAHLIEGGVSEAGIPYIAMELVDGVPITVAANARALSLQQRLVWFSTLCRTIEAAHAALIVHRDLKPSNLFITHEGGLKVLDFGIARVLGDDAVAGVTRTQSIALTPEYAAPEQFSSTQITTAVDIFSLGVVLGELLTGKRLGAAASASGAIKTPDEYAVRLPNGLPARSTLARQLEGDLDAILATALAHEPSMRYRNAGALADDIDRYLAGKPVRAHPPSRWYRLRKFIVRHRATVMATGVLLAGILISLALAVWKSVEANHAAQLAGEQATRAESMRRFMFDAFAEAEPATPRKGPPTIFDIVDRAIAKAKTDFSIDPHARLELLARLAEVIGAQGDLTRSASLLADAHAQVLRTFGEADPLAFEIGGLIEANDFQRGNYAAARVRIDALLARVPASSVALRCKLFRDSAGVAARTRDFARALTDIHVALALSEQSGDTELRRASLSDLAAVLLNSGDVPASIEPLKQVLAMNRARFGEESIQVAYILSGLSRAYRRMGDLDSAEEDARAVLAIDRKIYPGDHPILGNHLNALGITLVEKRKLREAHEVLLEAERIYRATLKAGHPDLRFAIQPLAAVEIRMEDYELALPRLREALDIGIATFGEHGFESSADRADYGYALAMTGRRAAGIQELERGITDLQTFEPSDPDMYGRALEKRIRVALLSADPAGAAQRIDRLADIADEVIEQAAYWRGRVDCLRGEIFLALGKPRDASLSLQKAADILGSMKGADPILWVEQPLLMAASAFALGDDAEARSWAAQGRARLARLAFPPQRLTQLEASLPR
ncbi:MAG: serine/threonine-protein kinase [Tahibacter sp.]